MESKLRLESPIKKMWEPMRLTPVGNLGAVMTAQNMSGTDGGTTAAMKA